MRPGKGQRVDGPHRQQPLELLSFMEVMEQVWGREAIKDFQSQQHRRSGGAAAVNAGQIKANRITT